MATGSLVQLIYSDAKQVPNEIITAYEKTYNQTSYGIPLTPTPSQFTASWSLPRYGDLVGDLVLRLDWPGWLDAYPTWTPYHFIERIVVTGGGVPLFTISGKQLYLLHQFQPTHLRETCTTAAKHGMLLIPSPFVLPMVACQFVTFNVQVVYINHCVCDAMQEHWLKEGVEVFGEVSVPNDLVNMIRLYCEGITPEEAELSLVTDYQFLNVSQRDEVVRNDHMVNIRRYEYTTLTADPTKTILNLPLHNLMTSIFFAVEKPDSPYDFYSTTEDPVKCVTLRVKNIERETHIDGREWLIADKPFNRFPLPEDVAL
jgi:hypothetical protein